MTNRQYARIEEMFFVFAISFIIAIPGSIFLRYIFKPAEIKILQSELDFNKILDSVVHIESDLGYQGTGCYIGNGLIVTAGHIVENTNSLKITFKDENTIISNVYYKEPNIDIGFIYIGDCNIPVLEFSKDEQIIGEDVYVCGNPLGKKFIFSVSKGIVSAIERNAEGFFGNKLMLQIDAASFPGNSGSPAINTDGEIIGIVVGGIYGAESLTLCIPCDVCEQSMNIYLEVLKLAELK